MSEGVICERAIQITPIICRAGSAGKEQTIQQTKPRTDYSKGNNPTTPFYHEGEQTATESRTAGTFTRRIGNTVYRVNVHYSRTNKETMRDKITRLVKNDVLGRGQINDGD